MWWKYKNNETIRIYGTDNSLKLLSFFIDSTYRCLTQNIKTANALVLLIGYNSERNMFELCCSAVFSKEDTTIYQKFYETLRINYSFKPKKITLDLALPNINSVIKNIMILI